MNRKKLLVPIDLDVEDSWLATFPVARDMNRDWGSEIHVMTVVPNFGMSVVGSFFPKGFEAKALENARESLSKLVADNFADERHAKAHVAHGTVYEEILNAADTLGVGIILMTSHRPELKDYLLGPNAARIVRHARQSVFVIRP